MPYTITSKTEGFRRAGIVHSCTPKTYADSDLTPDQMIALVKEPELEIVYVEPEIPELSMEDDAKPEPKNELAEPVKTTAKPKKK